RFEFGFSEICHTNVLCQPQYNDWCNELRAVVKYSFHRSVADPCDQEQNTGWFHGCSGVLVNRSPVDFEPVILTAQHCTVNGDMLNNWIFYFNFQSQTCTPDANGNDQMIVTGCSVLDTEHDECIKCPDITVLRLDENIPLQFNVFFSGWESRGWSDFPDNPRGVGIHHPMGDVKKISEGDIDNPLFQSCLHVDWDNVGTEFGSSGSPLFLTTSHRVVGTLSHGPPMLSPDGNEDWYNWLNKTWNTVGTHLNPGNNGVVGMDGIDPISACQNIVNLTRTFYPGNDWQNKNQIIIQASQQINIAANGIETAISNTPVYMPNSHNSDYIIRAGNHITIHPGFRINTPIHSDITGVYTTNFNLGSQNRVSFQIADCTPFIDECGFNHQALVYPDNDDDKNSETGEEIGIIAPSPTLSVYPNPATGNLNVEFAENFTLILIDMLGKTMVQGEKVAGGNLLLDISTYPPGVYYISVISGEFRESKPVIIQ
nr:T9SS type A sorting domain-containing protein [Bacteroidota bacterium]